MKREDTSLFDDPTTPGYVRDLLQAGRRANADYDVERGLARHLAAISGAPAPAANWAPATAAAKTWPSWIGIAAMPLAAASVASLLWVYAADRPEPDGSAMKNTGSADVAPAETQASDAPSVNAAPSAVRRTATMDDSRDEARPSSSERASRRSSARPNVARSRNTASNARSSADGDLENLAIGSSDAPAIETRSNEGAGKRSGSVEPSSTATAEAPEARPIAASPSQFAPSETTSQRTVDDEPEAVAEQARPGTEPATKPAPVIDESRLEREMQMLAVTQRVLASDPARALRLSEQGEREFGGSMFSAERRQLGLLALVKLGRLDEARRAGRPFLARYPKAPWSERLRRALATGVVE